MEGRTCWEVACTHCPRDAVLGCYGVAWKANSHRIKLVGDKICLEVACIHCSGDVVPDALLLRNAFGGRNHQTFVGEDNSCLEVSCETPHYYIHSFLT